MKRPFNYEVVSDGDYFMHIVIRNEFYGTTDHNEAMMILVHAARLMIGYWHTQGYHYHSFTLDKEALTIIIEDNTKYRVQNATKIAKHLERVYQVLMSRYGCGNGLKY